MLTKVYRIQELFNEALTRYNEKQIRSDRRIDDYYEKICSGKPGNPFHKIILQIGNRLAV
ncbi:hypothetical protein IMSAGC002_02661 [Lachnospiraceae bacterium]|nr:hypothetical protein IMSAGC002_02661 [Lachnospiraceae bacterium]